MNHVPVRPGDVLAGKYRVDRILGKGNMGVVVAATHVELGQRVALKFMLGQPDPEGRERFLREARAVVRLKSHHVARVLDVGTLEDGAPYIVMEFLEGRDLAAILTAGGPLPVDRAVEYVLHACEAVGEAHAAGIVHRDLKPANLFLTHDVSGAPCVKVLDFGISKLSGGVELTQDAQALGSPLYMSPEQMNSSRDVDARADVWALGVTLYQLVAGKTPFHADTVQALCARVLFGAPTPLAELLRAPPPGLEAAILRCIQRDVDRRCRNVAELAASLAPFAPASARPYPDRVARVLGVSASPPAAAPAPMPVGTVVMAQSPFASGGSPAYASASASQAQPAHVQPALSPSVSQAQPALAPSVSQVQPGLPPSASQAAFTPPLAAPAQTAIAPADTGLSLAASQSARVAPAAPARSVLPLVLAGGAAVLAAVAVVLVLVRDAGGKREPAPAATITAITAAPRPPRTAPASSAVESVTAVPTVTPSAAAVPTVTPSAAAPPPVVSVAPIAAPRPRPAKTGDAASAKPPVSYDERK
ncbi:MAG: protein kinase [Minicystis sp.]